MTHLIDGEFQSDKYPTCPRGKVPLSCKDPMAQDLLWEYAKRRAVVDAEFSNDLETALITAGFKVVVCEWCGSRHRTIFDDNTIQGIDCAASVDFDGEQWLVHGHYGSAVDTLVFRFVANAPSTPTKTVCDACIKARFDGGDLVEIDDPTEADDPVEAALGFELATEPFDKS